MADEEKSPKPIKVVDRRWFTGTGEPREGRQPLKRPEPRRDSGVAAGAESRPRESARPEAQSHSDRKPVRGEGAASGQPGRGGVSFAALVEFLAQQAILLLTGSEGVKPNRSQAKVFIDFLGVLQERTEGNLTNDEKQMLDDVLFQLRAAFVQSGR
ncbi:MAG: DUF1844 domain-containing protein [Acidobacteria bacterium]|nr:DUF1844 domain-containing protein [Acidobacteriota bacterium]